MGETLPQEKVERAIERYGDILFRLCLVMLGNAADAEDALQETYLRYLQKAPAFADEEHEKAWLLTVAANRCRDLIRYRARHPQVQWEGAPKAVWPVSNSGVLEAVMAVPETFRLVLLLYYVEEYSTAEIAKIIGRTPSAVRMRLKKGRQILERVYRKEYL